MKTLDFKLSALAIGFGIALLPAAAWSAAALDPTSDTTPGAEILNDSVLSAAPYAVPSNVVVPASSVENPADAGKFAHTNSLIFNPNGVRPNALTDLALPAPTANPANTFAETPASVSCVYGMGPTYAGCAPIINSAYNAKSGWGIIAIVIAYDDPYAFTDLQLFSSTFGLPAPNFIRIRVTKAVNSAASCTTVPGNAGWGPETSIDTQWAHAMAPGAKIMLFEACSNSMADLWAAEETAAQTLNSSGGGVISNSWSTGEWSGETSYDSVFHGYYKNIKFLFASGDSGIAGGPQYPSASPWVVSVGGTTINRDSSGNFVSESCWSGTGGGPSLYETWTTTFGAGNGPWTGYQYPLFGESNRQMNDIAAVGDPSSGVYISYNGAWYVYGGTSVATPILAGIMSNAANQLGQAPAAGGYYSNTENNLLYAELLTSKDYPAHFYDVTTGSNGIAAAAGWDNCTGVGTPRGKVGK